MNKLKQACKARKISFQDVASKMGVSKQYISSLSKESSTASIKKFREIANVIADLSGEDAHEIFCEIIGCR